MMAHLTSFLLAAFAVTVPVLSAPSQAPPPFCHGLDCPTYTVLNKTSDWELRRYNSVMWASTTTDAMTFETVRTEMFMRLFQYISGANTQKTKIAMTAPVVDKIAHGQGPNCESTFVMHFMIPHEMWKSPLPPTDPKVTIQQTPAMDVYVRSFGGFPEDADYVKNVELLAKSIPSGAQVEDKFFFTAGYDGPYKFTDRHNEVWLQKL